VTASPTRQAEVQAPWLAPRARGPLDAVVSLPGSKSITNRALVLSALADTSSRIIAPLRARDTEWMAAGLRGLGVTVRDDGPDWAVEPAALRGPATLDCGQAGTALRFLPGVAALATGEVRVVGHPRMSERPVAALLDALRAVGAAIEGARTPFVVRGSGRVAGGRVTVDASASSQLLSGLLLPAARFDAGLTVQHEGPPLPSAPHIRMTVAMLRDRGVSVDDAEADVWRVQAGQITGGEITVEPDLSNAAPFLAAAVIAGGRVTVPSWPASTSQPGERLTQLLELAGGRVRRDDGTLTVEGSGQVLGFDVDLRDESELVPVMAALAVVAESPSRLRGIAHTRGHETDRIAALARELSGLGAEMTELPDGLAITPRPLAGRVMQTYEDHRLATAAALLGLVVDDVRVENVATTAKTMPDFVDRWYAMLEPS
jgi:3-phosphoshikimate 1-carboxyvinyltransferase